MKILLIALFLISCSKPNETPTTTTVKVKGSVINEIKPPGPNQQYWKAGLIFDKEVTATGTATITWYFSAGFLNGNPSNRYEETVNFNLTGNTNGYYEFTNWQVDHTMIADSVKIRTFSASGNYNFILQ